MYNNKGGTLQCPARVEVQVLHDPTFLCKCPSSDHLSNTHNLLSQRWHTPGAPVCPWCTLIQLTCPTQENRHGGKRTVGVIQYHGAHLCNFYVEKFFKYSCTQWKRNLPNFFLNKICQNADDKPSSKFRSFWKPVNLYKRRIYWCRAGIQSSTILGGSPVEHIFHPCDRAEATALHNPHVSATANPISHPAYVTVISLLFSAVFTAEAALFFALSLLLPALPSCLSPVPLTLTLFPAPVIPNMPYRFP